MDCDGNNNFPLYRYFIVCRPISACRRLRQQRATIYRRQSIRQQSSSSTHCSFALHIFYVTKIHRISRDILTSSNHTF
ncbi:hypothetical protein DERP_003971 [Dermatophagoides pteronyssinus]|uniref:Uncharacterized protein n=1 Tax=Dermatophagoides pteronyssinus TaxID=6956 RepID=A0ABQ8J8E5_DERPT|nr:hypothetical protein DERP_003971 [Dermatophagoides pteronyssinus]